MALWSREFLEGLPVRMERAVRCSFAAAATSANDTDAPRRSPCRRRPIP